MLLPPVKVSVSVPTVTLSSEPESAATVNVAEPTCESTYALIDCCVASAVALSLPIASSSKIDDTVAPEASVKSSLITTEPSEAIVNLSVPSEISTVIRFAVCEPTPLTASVISSVVSPVIVAPAATTN